MLQLVNSFGFDLQGRDNATRRRLGVYFHGVNGTLFADYGSHKIVPEGEKRRPPVFLVYTPDVKVEAIKIAKSMRQKNQKIPFVLDVMGRSLGAQIKAAAGSGADYVVIVGRDEIDSGKLTLRDMRGGEQESLSPAEIEEKLKIHFQLSR